MPYSLIWFILEAGPTATPWPDSLVSSIYIALKLRLCSDAILVIDEKLSGCVS